METSTITQNETMIEGINFNGIIKIAEDKVILDITEYSKPNFYRTEFTNADIKATFPLLNLTKFQKELITNKKMEITDTGSLRIPFTMIYQQQTEEMRLNFPLKIQQCNQQTKIARLGSNLLKFTNIYRSYVTTYIRFQKDETNTGSSQFQINNNGKNIKYLKNNVWSICNHKQKLPKSGKYVIKALIQHITNKKMFFGVCDQSIKNQQNPANSPYSSPLFACLQLVGNIYANGTSRPVLQKFNANTKSIVRMEIDMNEKRMEWYIDDFFVDEHKLNKQMQQGELFIIIAMAHVNDEVRILQK